MSLSSKRRKRALKNGTWETRAKQWRRSNAPLTPEQRAALERIRRAPGEPAK